MKIRFLLKQKRKISNRIFESYKALFNEIETQGEFKY